MNQLHQHDEDTDLNEDEELLDLTEDEVANFIFASSLVNLFAEALGHRMLEGRFFFLAPPNNFSYVTN